MIYESQFQIDYRVSAGASWLRLLSHRDLLITDVSREYDMATQSTELIDRAWSDHRARGNAAMTLSWENLVSGDSPAEVERALSLNVQRLLTQREGVMRLHSAYYGGIASLVQDWTAVLTGVSHRLVWSEENPELTPPAALPHEQTWGAIQYQFTLTHPRNA